MRSEPLAVLADQLRVWLAEEPRSYDALDERCSYLYAAFEEAVRTTHRPQDLLLVLAADSTAEHCRKVLGEHPVVLLALAREALWGAHEDARWQLAVALGELDDPEARRLLRHYMVDTCSYVRRRARLAGIACDREHVAALNAHEQEPEERAIVELALRGVS